MMIQEKVRKNDSNNKTESDDEKDNDEPNERFVKSQKSILTTMKELLLFISISLSK